VGVFTLFGYIIMLLVDQMMSDHSSDQHELEEKESLVNDKDSIADDNLVKLGNSATQNKLSKLRESINQTNKSV